MWFSGVGVAREDRAFRGKLESEWIAELKYNDDAQEEEWKGYGEEGIDVLLRGLRSIDRSGERAYRKVFRKAPTFVRRWMPGPKQDAEVGRRHCIIALLSEAGEESPRVVPVMIRTALEDESDGIRQSAIGHFITSSGDDALGNRLPREQKKALLPALLRAVENGESGAHNAVILLRYYGEYAEVVVPVVLKALKDGKPSVRGYAAEALNRIAPKVANEAGATEVLIEVANDPDDQVGFRAVEGLGRATNRVEVAVPALVKFLESTNTLIACQAVWALEWAPMEFDEYRGVITNALGRAAERKDTAGSYAKVALKRWSVREVR